MTSGDDGDDPIADEVRAILDGHIVLSARAAPRATTGRRSIAVRTLSRVMDELVDDEHRRAAARLREVLATYERQRDLVLLGAYRKGADRATDDAHGAPAGGRGLPAADGATSASRSPTSRRALIELIRTNAKAKLRPSLRCHRLRPALPPSRRARAAAEPLSPVLAAMQAELSRDMARLRLKGYEAPYFIAYAVRDYQQRSVGSRFGAPIDNAATSHSRQACAEVRVGDYQFDNTSSRPRAAVRPRRRRRSGTRRPRPRSTTIPRRCAARCGS